MAEKGHAGDLGDLIEYYKDDPSKLASKIADILKDDQKPETIDKIIRSGTVPIMFSNLKAEE